MTKRIHLNIAQDYSSFKNTSWNKCSGQKKKLHGRVQEIISRNRCYSGYNTNNFNGRPNKRIDRNFSKDILLDKHKSKQKNLNFIKKHSDNTHIDSVSTCSMNSIQKYSDFHPKNKKKCPIRIFDVQHSKQTLFLNRKKFIILGLLGQGQTAKVFKAIQAKTGFIIALKVIQKKAISKHPRFQKQIMRQIKINCFLNHPNIIKIYGIGADHSSIYIMMQLATDSRLLNYIEKNSTFSDKSASIIIREILNGVKAMHQNRIIHRDLKPQNIVTVLGTVKICDFGWATHLKDKDLAETYCGTPLYFSPEIILREKYDEKVDIWALGIIFFEMLMGKMPFDITEQQDLPKIVNEQIKYDFSTSIFEKPSFRALAKIKFLKSFLFKNPALRKNIHQLREMEFIKTYEEYQIVPELLI